MCARYSLHATNALIADLFDLSVEPDLSPRYNIAPSTMIPAIIKDRNSNGEKSKANVVAYFKWGLVPSWAKDKSIGVKLFNARSETAAEKPSFRAAMKYRRCLIPASGFFEWVDTPEGKQPYFVSIIEQEVFAIAGLYEHWETPDEYLESCTILTTSANTVVKPIHDRMPVIIPKESFDFWLDPEIRTPAALAPLLESHEIEGMRIFPVTKKVGNPRYDYPDAIEPIRAGENDLFASS